MRVPAEIEITTNEKKDEISQVRRKRRLRLNGKTKKRFKRMKLWWSILDEAEKKEGDKTRESKKRERERKS